MDENFAYEFAMSACRDHINCYIATVMIAPCICNLYITFERIFRTDLFFEFFFFLFTIFCKSHKNENILQNIHYLFNSPTVNLITDRISVK